MPYFVFHISPEKKLRYMADYEGYRDARGFAREQRKELSADDESQIKVIFAPNESQAQKLLLAKREPRPMGEDA